MGYCNKINTALFRLCLATASIAGLYACGGSAAPLDADTRATIDSIATAQIAKTRAMMDSVCVVTEQTQMTHLVDSIKKIRLMEIEEQLKSVPK